MPLANVQLNDVMPPPNQKKQVRNLSDATPASPERSSKMSFILASAAMLVLANIPGLLPAEPAKPRSQTTPKVTLYEGLGRHTRPVATSNPEAQRFFDQGL